MGAFVSVAPLAPSKGNWLRESERNSVVASIRELLHWHPRAEFTLMAHSWLPANSKPEDGNLHVASCTTVKLLVTDSRSTAARLLEQWTTGDKNLLEPKDRPSHIYTRICDLTKAGAIDWLIANGYPGAGELE